MHHSAHVREKKLPFNRNAWLAWGEVLIFAMARGETIHGAIEKYSAEAAGICVIPTMAIAAVASYYASQAWMYKDTDYNPKPNSIYINILNAFVDGLSRAAALDSLIENNNPLISAGILAITSLCYYIQSRPYDAENATSHNIARMGEFSLRTLSRANTSHTLTKMLFPKVTGLAEGVFATTALVSGAAFYPISRVWNRQFVESTDIETFLPGSWARFTDSALRSMSRCLSSYQLGVALLIALQLASTISITENPEMFWGLLLSSVVAFGVSSFPINLARIDARIEKNFPEDLEMRPLLEADVPEVVVDTLEVNEKLPSTSSNQYGTAITLGSNSEVARSGCTPEEQLPQER